MDRLIDLYDREDYDTIITYWDQNINIFAEVDSDISSMIISKLLDKYSDRINYYKILEWIICSGPIDLLQLVLHRTPGIITKIDNWHDPRISFNKICQSSRLNFLEIFIENGVDPNCLFIKTIIERAIRYNNLDMITYALDANYDVQAAFDNLMESWQGQSEKEMIILLMDHGIDIHKWITQLHMNAVTNSQLDFAIFCLNNGADIHDDPSCLLDTCCENCDINILKYLLENGLDVNHICMGCIENILCDPSISKNDSFAFIKYMINNGFDLSDRLNHLMIQSIAHDNSELLTYCMELGADIHTDDGVALFAAVHYRHTHMINFLLESGADINAGDDSILIFMTGRNDRSLPYDFGKNNLNFYSADSECVHFKSENFCEIFKLLVKNGATINDPDILILLLGNEYVDLDGEIVEYIVDNVDINFQCRTNILFNRGHGQWTSVLLTALEACAVFPAKSNLGKLLLGCGADYTANDYKAFRLAFEHKNYDLVDILLDLNDPEIEKILDEIS